MGPHWYLTKDGDVSCMALFKRHYSAVHINRGVLRKLIEGASRYAAWAENRKAVAEMHYIIVRGDRYNCPDSTQEAVNIKIKEGYVPVGGICCWQSGGDKNIFFAQAMISTAKTAEE